MQGALPTGMDASFTLATSPADLATLFTPEAWDIVDDADAVELDDCDLAVVVPPVLPSPTAAAERLVDVVRRRRQAEAAVAAAEAALATLRAEEAPVRAAARAAMANAGVTQVRVAGGRVVGIGRALAEVGGGNHALRLSRLRVDLTG